MLRMAHFNRPSKWGKKERRFLASCVVSVCSIAGVGFIAAGVAQAANGTGSGGSSITASFDCNTHNVTNLTGSFPGFANTSKNVEFDFPNGAVQYVNVALDGDGNIASTGAPVTASGTPQGGATNYSLDDIVGGGKYEPGTITFQDCTAKPVASLTVTPSSGNAPLQVKADASVSTNATSYNFVWGDGSLPTGFQSSPTATHTYSSGGSFTVTVTAKNDSGTDTASKIVTVSQTPPPPTCKSDSNGSSQVYYSNLEWGGLSNYGAALKAAKPGDSIQLTGTVTVPEGCTTDAFDALYLQPQGTTKLVDQQPLSHSTATYGAGTHQVQLTVTLPTSGTGEGQLCGKQEIQPDSGTGAYIADFHNGDYGSRKFANGFSGLVTVDFGSCEQPPLKVTATAPTFYEVCGTANDAYTVPSLVTGVKEYDVNGTAKPGGTYAGSGTVNITAVADEGYALTGTSSWSYTFTNVACPQPVNPVLKVHATGTFVCMANGFADASGTVDLSGSTEGASAEAVDGNQRTSQTIAAGGTWDWTLKHVPDSSTIAVNVADAPQLTIHVTGCSMPPGPIVTPPVNHPSPAPTAVGPVLQTDGGKVVVAEATTASHSSLSWLYGVIVAIVVGTFGALRFIWRRQTG